MVDPPRSGIVATSFRVGLEEGPDGATRAHALDLLGCAAEGTSPEAAVERFSVTLSAWLRFVASLGEAVPSPEVELEIQVDEWIRTDADVAAGQTDVCFEADLRRLEVEEIESALRRFGDLRGGLLRAVRNVQPDRLDEASGSGWSTRAILEELARAEWWTLSRLGASPLAEVPARTLGRLDTAAALVVGRFTELPAESRGAILELDGETWTPRKVLRRILWLEWSLGDAAIRALGSVQQSESGR